MKKYIIISPYSRKLINNKSNPKNYPYWQNVINKLKHEFNFIQIGSTDEPKLQNIYEYKYNLSFIELTNLIHDINCHCWISVDNFLPHFCANINSPGIVIWGQSDPKIFGYDMHINLLKSRTFLRSDQFNIWECTAFNEHAFVSPNTIINQIKNFKKINLCD